MKVTKLSTNKQSAQCETGGSCAALGQDTVTQHMAGYSEVVDAAKDQV